MEFMHWAGIAGGIAVAATGWFFVARMVRSWKSLDARPSDRSSATTGSGTAFGKLSTIR